MTIGLWSIFPDLADYEVAKSKIDMSMFEELPNLKPATMKALVKDLADTQKHDEQCEKLRYKKLWVQSNSFTDQLAADARILRMVSASIMGSEGKGGEYSLRNMTCPLEKRCTYT